MARQAILLEDRIGTFGALVERRGIQFAGKREGGSARSAILATLAVAAEGATTARDTLSSALAGLVLNGLTAVRALVNGILIQSTIVRELARADDRLACAVTAVASTFSTIGMGDTNSSRVTDFLDLGSSSRSIAKVDSQSVDRLALSRKLRTAESASRLARARILGTFVGSVNVNLASVIALVLGGRNGTRSRAHVKGLLVEYTTDVELLPTNRLVVLAHAVSDWWRALIGSILNRARAARAGPSRDWYRSVATVALVENSKIILASLVKSRATGWIPILAVAVVGFGLGRALVVGTSDDSTSLVTRLARGRICSGSRALVKTILFQLAVSAKGRTTDVEVVLALAVVLSPVGNTSRTDHALAGSALLTGDWILTGTRARVKGIFVELAVRTEVRSANCLVARASAFSRWYGLASIVAIHDHTFSSLALVASDRLGALAASALVNGIVVGLARW